MVTQFYQDITDHNYAAAWTLGGENVSSGVGYDAWVAGYGTTESISLGTFSYFGSGGFPRQDGRAAAVRPPSVWVG